MDVEPVAAYALQQTVAGQAIIIPGFLNKVIRVLSYGPRWAILAVVSTLYGKTARRRRRRKKPATQVCPA